MRTRFWVVNRQAFTLIEMLCTVAIIAILATLLLPAIDKGKRKAQQTVCSNNLRHQGLAFQSFAQDHESRFPTQVSTNLGGSLEFLQAGESIEGAFYFSYRHFLPLSRDLASTKALVCPADSQRTAAANFPGLLNTNLSYFIAANPELGQSDSILTGDRNVWPSVGSVALLNNRWRLEWTHELHKYSGNVLFADGHVESRNRVLSLSNAPAGKLVKLVMPTLKPRVIVSPQRAPALATTTMPVPLFTPWGALALTTGSMPDAPGITNIGITSIASQTPNGLFWASGGRNMAPQATTRATSNAPIAAVTAPANDNSIPDQTRIVAEPETDTQQARQGNSPFRGAPNFIPWVPWLLIVLLLLLSMELVRRARARKKFVPESFEGAARFEPALRR